MDTSHKEQEMALKHNVLRENWERNLNLIYMQEALKIMRTKTHTLKMGMYKNDFTTVKWR